MPNGTYQPSTYLFVTYLRGTSIAPEGEKSLHFLLINPVLSLYFVSQIYFGDCDKSGMLKL